MKHPSSGPGATLLYMATTMDDPASRPIIAAGPQRPQPLSQPPAPGFVALSRFVVANGMASEVKAAFRSRPHLVDSASGYIRMDVISPLELPEELWLITFWTDQASFTAWHHGHLYHAAHHGIPKGLKLVPGETEIRKFEHVAG